MPDNLEQDLIKYRDIIFSRLHPDPAQAESAMLLLSDVSGVVHLHRAAPTCLHIGYDIRELTLKMIESALLDVGFHLDNNLLCKLKRALFHYTEETQRINLGLHQQDGSTHRKIFVHRYAQLPHGCRDDRPDYWRKYL
jgi:hypothetical protein